MTLLACGTAGREHPTPEPAVVVRTVRETPPAELTRCPVAPAGLPTTGEAVIPPDWRAGIVRLARSHGSLMDQLNRLIAWQTGQDCAAGTAP